MMGEQPPMILYHGRMTRLVVSLGSTKPFIVIGKSLERATLKGWGKNVLFGNTTFKIFWTKLRLEKQIEKKTNYYIIITPKMVCPLHLSPLRILTFLHDISSSNLNYVAIMFGGKVLRCHSWEDCMQPSGGGGFASNRNGVATGL